jgi:hypothetical protein
MPYLVVMDGVAQGMDTGFSTQRISSRTMRGLTAVGFGIPIAVYLWFLHHYSLNVVRSDQWSDVTLISKSYGGALTLSALWAQHADNRILFPNLIVLAMSRIDAFNISVEEYISASFLFAAIALIIVTHKSRSPDRPWIAYCPVAIVMASVVQAENILWGFQLAWYLVLVLLAGVIFILDRPSLSKLGTVGAVMLAVIGSYSSVQGLLIWIAGLLLLFYRRRPTPLIAVWMAVGTLTTVLYVYKLDIQAGVPSYLTAIHLPRQAVRFYFESIGDVLGVPLRSNGVGADLVTGVGIVIVALALFALWFGHRYRAAESAAPVGMALIVFGLLFAFSTTWGRTYGGPAAASASRYTTYDLLILVGAYLTFLALPRSAVSTRKSSRIMTRTVAAMLGCLIILVAVFGFVNGIRWARSSNANQILQAAVTVDIDHIPDNLVKTSLLELETPASQLRLDAHTLAAHGLSLYSDPQAVARYRSIAATLTKEGVFRYKPPPPTEVEFPATGAVLSGKTLLIASTGKGLYPVRVDFVLSRGAVRQKVIATKLGILGWTARWNTSSVPNGSYLLQSVVDTKSGVIASHPIVINVRN